MEKDRRYTVRLPKKDADILEKHCSEQNIPIAEFMRAATRRSIYLKPGVQPMNMTSLVNQVRAIARPKETGHLK